LIEQYICVTIVLFLLQSLVSVEQALEFYQKTLYETSPLV